MESMKILYCNAIMILLFAVMPLYPQAIEWQELQRESLPDSVRLFKGTRGAQEIYYLDISLNNDNLAVRPYITSNKETVDQFVKSVGAYAAVNGGYFDLGGNTSYSSVVYPGAVKAVNVPSVTRNAKSYPVIRSAFGLDTLGNPFVKWIYHFDMSLEGLYQFAEPMPYTLNDPDPLPAPDKSQGMLLADIQSCIGGGPVLVKDGQIHITYNEEVMWGAGIDGSRERTAVGFTSDRHVIMLVVRTAEISDLAQIMLDLGCEDAMNLDGGGSTQLALADESILYSSRAVPTILALVHADSLGLPQKPLIEKIIDTADTLCSLDGGGWFPTANAGYWGATASMLHSKGTGSATATFRPLVNRPAEYKVFGWWVSSSNRSTDTPFVIVHRDGRDTVRVNQAINGSMWFPVGDFFFAGNPEEAVIISDAASTNGYVVADAIRLVAYDTTSSALTETRSGNPGEFVLRQNYPNPFNSETRISYHLPESGRVTITIYNFIGQIVEKIADGETSAGFHAIHWRPAQLSSGLYFCELRVNNARQLRKMVLLK